jgi:hypothetical protein
MQNWLRYQFYPNEFLDLVYNYYAVHGVASVCTYYHVDIDNSILEDTKLEAGYYELIGNLTGVKFQKINFLPVYNLEGIQPRFSADEKGMTKSDQMTTFNIPTSYNIIPTMMDHVIFDALPLRQNTESLLTAYQVTNMEKSTNTDISFWKEQLKVSYRTKGGLDSQTIETYTFFDYEKKIYSAEDAILLYNLLFENDQSTLNKFYSKNSGLYLGV